MYSLQMTVKNFRERLEVILTSEEVVVETMVKKGIVNRATGENYLAMLNVERGKMERFDLPIAVVGATKAGKSTTINAIVGQEILPFRNFPMTRIPTLIRNEKGQINPKLILPKWKLLNKMLERLKTELENVGFKKFDRYLMLSDSQVAQQVLSSYLYPLKNIYVSQEEIYQVLIFINDVVRLLERTVNDERIFDVLPPYRALVEDTSELPTIEVEFTGMHGNDIHTLEERLDILGMGKLILIDTPGADEVEQKYLASILNNQIINASAIIWVMNYQKIGTEEEMELAKRIKNTISNYENLFVLVNQFDAYEAGGLHLNKQDVIRHVNFLFDNKLKSNRVFPTSSKYSYLAKRVSSMLKYEKRIDDTTSWAKDFWAWCYGNDYSSERTVGKAESCSEQLWEYYEFADFMDSIEEFALRDASTKVIKVAVEKLNFVNTQLGSKLRESLSVINLRLENVSGELEETFNNVSVLTQSIRDAEKCVQNLVNRLQAEVKGIIVKEFEQVIIKKPEANAEYKDKAAAEMIVRQLYSLTTQSLLQAQKNTQLQINSMAKLLENDVEKCFVDKLESLPIAVMQEFGRLGSIAPKIVLQKIVLNQYNMEPSDTVFSNHVLDSKSRIVTWREERDFFSKAGTLFTSGSKKRSATENYFIVDYEKGADLISSRADSIMHALLAEIEKYTLPILIAEVQGFFEVFKSKILIVLKKNEDSSSKGTVQKKELEDARQIIMDLLGNLRIYSDQLKVVEDDLMEIVM